MQQSAIVLSVDRLGAGFLGPYGNTWLETPGVNRFASESLLVETCLAETPDLAQAYDRLWGGDTATSATSLQERLKSQGLRTVLVTDEVAVGEHSLASQFDEQHRLPFGRSEEAGSSEETALASLFDVAIERLQAEREPLLLWIHAQGMEGPWDAPYAMRAALADEEDPPPSRIIEPPQERIAGEIDPDQRLGFVQAYGAQVQVLDECLARFREALHETPWARNALVALFSPRGYPLAEHGRIGKCDHALFAELIQVPLLMRLSNNVAALARTQHLFQLGDLREAIAAWCCDTNSSDLLAAARGEQHVPREVAISHFVGQRAIRTPAWFLRESLQNGQTTHELFAKPDDRFEVNEVASRCGEEVTLLLEQLDIAEKQQSAGERLTLARDIELLRDVWR